MKLATKIFLEVKLQSLNYFSKAETEYCHQEDWSVFDTFGIITPCSATNDVEARAPVSLKLATKGSLEGRKDLKI